MNESFHFLCTCQDTESQLSRYTFTHSPPSLSLSSCSSPHQTQKSANFQTSTRIGCPTAANQMPVVGYLATRDLEDPSLSKCGGVVHRPDKQQISRSWKRNNPPPCSPKKTKELVGINSISVGDKRTHAYPLQPTLVRPLSIGLAPHYTRTWRSTHKKTSRSFAS